MTSDIFKSTSLTLAELHDSLGYDPETGIFTYKKKLSSNVVIGRVAGYVHQGYARITIQKNQYAAHRLAWFHFYGKWPDLLIDHINGIGTDNRIENLRLATFGENSQNQRRLRSNNTSGFTGVSLNVEGRWLARIAHNRKRIEIGLFDNKEDAAAAYEEMKRKLHPFQTIFT